MAQLSIESLNIQFKWQLATNNESDDTLCLLCQQNLVAPSVYKMVPNSKSLYDLTETIVVGECGHKFHKSCMDENNTNLNVVSCPIDNTMWRCKYSYTSMPLYGKN
jgi:hypothetical protein